MRWITMFYVVMWPMLVGLGGIIFESIDQVLGSLIVTLGFLSGCKAIVEGDKDGVFDC